MHSHLFASETSLYIALHNFPLTAQHIKGFLVFYIIHNLLALVSLTNPLIFLNTFKASLSSSIKLLNFFHINTPHDQYKTLHIISLSYKYKITFKAICNPITRKGRGFPLPFRHNLYPSYSIM